MENQVQQENRQADKPVKKHKKWKRFRNISIVVLVLGFAAFFAIRFYYPFGEGVKTGQLNFVVYKGVVFKTYEGRLIQTGFRSNQQGGIQSNEFNFSVADKQIAEQLMNAGGKVVELRYKEYFGALPWRGYSKFIVDKIIRIEDSAPAGVDSYPPVNPPQ